MESRPPKTYNIAEAKSRLSELVQRARLGEEVVIARDNKPVARLVPLVNRGQPRSPGSAKDQILQIAPDFDAPLADFKDYE